MKKVLVGLLLTAAPWQQVRQMAGSSRSRPMPGSRECPTAWTPVSARFRRAPVPATPSPASTSPSWVRSRRGMIAGASSATCSTPTCRRTSAQSSIGCLTARQLERQGYGLQRLCALSCCRGSEGFARPRRGLPELLARREPRSQRGPYRGPQLRSQQGLDRPADRGAGQVLLQ